jgi:hypothetical protein
VTRVRKIDFGDRDWTAHAQDHWLEFAGNSNFPDYLRVTFVAYGRHAANGHAKLERGELARYLIRKDGTLPDRRTVWRAIESAARLGYLLPESRQLCLVVSSHQVQGGRGSADARCTRDHTVKPHTNVRSERGRFATNVRSDAGRSETNVRSDCGRSTLSPSLSSTDLSQPPNREVSA